MPTVALRIFIPEQYHEFLIAELAELDFESFEEEEHHLVAYIPSARWDDVKREQILSWLSSNDVSATLKEEVIPDQNWNRQWEETIGPVLVDPFLIKPTWRETPSEYRDRILLEIDPKMSFGTGYHETTRLLLRLMPDFVKPGDRVLDAGTGTGVLAIAAVKLGAVSATAFDIDPWSQENAVENFYLNRVQDQVKMIHGGIEKLPSGTFDVILANINLNVILGLLPEFADRLKADGTLLLSGVLQPDRDRLLVAAQRSGLDMITEANENEWWAGAFMRIQDLREGIRTRPVEFVESRRRHPVVDCLAQVEVASPVASHERAKGGAVWNNRRHPLSYSAMKSGAQPRVSPPSFARPGWQFQEIRCSMRWPASLSRKAVKTSYG